MNQEYINNTLNEILTGNLDYIKRCIDTIKELEKFVDDEDSTKEIIGINIRLCYRGIDQVNRALKMLGDSATQEQRKTAQSTIKTTKENLYQYTKRYALC